MVIVVAAASYVDGPQPRSGVPISHALFAKRMLVPADFTVGHCGLSACWCRLTAGHCVLA